MASVSLAIPMGFPRIDQPDYLERDVVDEVEFDADQCSFYEALGDAGYVHLVHANWLHYGGNEWRTYVDGRVGYVAEVVQ